ncbi:MAG TPA: hypothetical protein VK920_00335 [Solirubrobacterales bacterium]|nr:hypothetical protein [Solirubrobacterales bacterium]
MSYSGNGAAPTTQVTIRRLGGDDEAAVSRLAERDSARRPAGELLGAEVDGRLAAAISLTDREVIADPFHPTREVVEVLRLRARQLDGRHPNRGRRLLSWMRGPGAEHASVAPAPPGAGGRVLTLSHRPEC